ncbi:CAP domain-containing protein [Paucibacter soli]|uniref:CAP domain-containing protein n=1 Tax=Paucibacter soli TaxID=3133433 RepID=UPI00309EFE68
MSDVRQTSQGRGRGGAYLPACALALLLSACGGGGGDAAAPAPAPGPAVADCGLPDFQAELLRLVNEQRARGGLCGSTRFAPAPALRWNTLLGQAAARHALDMAAHDHFSHTGTDGSDAGARISASGYRWSRWGENIAAGYDSSAAVVAGWIASEGHCRNLMQAEFTEIGLACVRSNAGQYRIWWAQTLAAP